MQITTIGLDIAENVFQVHGIGAAETGATPLQGRGYCAGQQDGPRRMGPIG